MHPRLAIDVESYLFEDLLPVAERIAPQVDYIYVFDHATRFNEPVGLGDIGGDLVAVSHPMYPREDWAWCDMMNEKEAGGPKCGYPLIRNPSSRAYVPPEVSAFIRVPSSTDGRLTISKGVALCGLTMPFLQ